MNVNSGILGDSYNIHSVHLIHFFELIVAHLPYFYNSGRRIIEILLYFCKIYSFTIAIYSKIFYNYSGVLCSAASEWK